ncbi:MAG: glutathione S-transferase family protein [Parvibaculaceae bacterium]
MILYYAETMNSYKTCAVARHVGLDIEFSRVDLKKGEQRSAEFLAVNPNGKAPALVDGDVRLWESNAIMCHLAIKAGSDLWPQGARQAEVIRWFSWSSDHFSRFAGELYFENIIRAQFGMGEPNAEAVQEATGYVRKYARILNAHLDDRRYLLGADLTLADFAVATTLPYAREAKIPIEDFPAVQRWHDRLMDLPAWRTPFVN